MKKLVGAAGVLNKLAALTYAAGKSYAYIRDAQGNKIRIGIFMEKEESCDPKSSPSQD